MEVVFFKGERKVNEARTWHEDLLRSSVDQILRSIYVKRIDRNFFVFAESWANWPEDSRPALPSYAPIELKATIISPDHLARIHELLHRFSSVV